MVLEDPRESGGMAREGPPLNTVLDSAMQKLKPAVGSSRPHIWSRLPLHPATSKVNRQALAAQHGERTARETNWHQNLRSLQRRMLRGYAAWHALLGTFMLLRACLNFPDMVPETWKPSAVWDASPHIDVLMLVHRRRCHKLLSAAPLSADQGLTSASGPCSYRTFGEQPWPKLILNGRGG